MNEAQVVHDFQANQRINALQVEVEELRGVVTALGGGDGGGKDMSDELTNHKIAASEARAETKLVRLEGKIDLLSSSIENLGSKIDSQRNEAASNRNVVVATVVGTALSIAALLYAILTYGASTFYNGTVVRDIVHNEVSAARPAANTPSNGGTPAH
jgi:hypothetical protein